MVKPNYNQLQSILKNITTKALISPMNTLADWPLSQLQIRGGSHMIFFLFLHENICCGYSLKRLGEALLMSTHNICFRAEIRKVSIFFVEKKKKKSTLSGAMTFTIPYGVGIY